MRAEIDAIAFDIDGTLYPNWGLYRLLGSFLVKNARLMSAFGSVRREIRVWQKSHPAERHEDFFGWQASLVASRLGCGCEEARRLLEEKIYEGWKPLFARVKPYPHAAEALAAFRASGLRTGLLSDFRPEQKGDVWGMAASCDAVIGSEETGALKPSPYPFMALSEALGVPPARMLYVGNSIASDVIGASSCGMKTACIISPLSALLGRKAPGADISFSSYRQLTRIVLK
jgi:Predicted hydrolase (HAD superfamily)